MCEGGGGREKERGGKVGARTESVVVKEDLLQCGREKREVEKYLREKKI